MNFLLPIGIVLGTVAGFFLRGEYEIWKLKRENEKLRSRRYEGRVGIITAQLLSDPEFQKRLRKVFKTISVNAQQKQEQKQP